MGSKKSGTPKADLLILDGHQEKDGKLTKTNFFDFLQQDLADYSDIKLTPEEALTFRNHVVRLKYGTSAAIPMICSGSMCLNKLCPLHATHKYPLSRPCMLETRLIQSLTASYVEDLDIDPESITEMTLVNKLVECDLLDVRVNLGLSGNNDEEAITLLKTNIVDNGKTTSETTTVHPLLEIKEKLQRIRNQILESFAATRREKYKRAAALGESDESDASVYLSELKALYDSAKDTQKASSLDRIKEDAEKVSFDASIIEADWSSDE